MATANPQKSRSFAYCVGANLPLRYLMIHNGAAEMATMSETFQTNCGVNTNARSTGAAAEP